METIIFEFDTKYGTYRDALHLPADHGLTEDQIAAMKQERRDNWLAIIEASANAPAEETTADA